MVRKIGTRKLLRRQLSTDSNQRLTTLRDEGINLLSSTAVDIANDKFSSTITEQAKHDEILSTSIHKVRIVILVSDIIYLNSISTHYQQIMDKIL